MFVVIGGSGMLFEASRFLVEKYPGAFLLCGREEARYRPILLAAPHARFFRFDFSAKADYGRLRQYLAAEEPPLRFLVWVHSPYYPYLADLLDDLGEKVRQVYLVKGSNGCPLPKAWLDSQRMTVIQLGRHPTEERWLTHQEICHQVLQEMDNLALE